MWGISIWISIVWRVFQKFSRKENEKERVWKICQTLITPVAVGFHFQPCFGPVHISQLYLCLKTVLQLLCGRLIKYGWHTLFFKYYGKSPKWYEGNNTEYIRSRLFFYSQVTDAQFSISLRLNFIAQIHHYLYLL